MELELWQLDLKYAALRIADPAHAARVLAALCAHGQRQPVLVVAGDAPDRYVLIDGYARVAALSALKRDTVQATVLAVPEVEALVLASRLAHGRARSALEEGWLLRVLVRDHGVAQAALAAALGRSASWVSRRLALVEALPAAAEAAVRAGHVAPQAAMKCLVPLARANAAQCTQLLANCAGAGAPVEPNSLLRHWYAGSLGIRQRGLYAMKDTFVVTALYRVRESGEPIDIPWLERQTGVRYETLKRHCARWWPDDRDVELRKFAALYPELFELGVREGSIGPQVGPQRVRGRAKLLETLRNRECERGDLNPKPSLENSRFFRALTAKNPHRPPRSVPAGHTVGGVGDSGRFRGRRRASTPGWRRVGRCWRRTRQGGWQSVTVARGCAAEAQPRTVNLTAGVGL